MTALSTLISHSRSSISSRPRPLVDKHAHALSTNDDRAISLAATTGYLLIALQFGAMVALSAVQYARYSLSNDFGGYTQAWRAIGHGHLDPWVSIFGVDFLHNNADLALYPLALFEPIVHSALLLSVAQDLALAATGAIGIRFVYEITTRSRLAKRASVGIVLGASVLFVVNPITWQTAAFPIHFEPFAALFALLCARALYQERWSALWCWALVAMCSEALGSLYILAVGAAGILLGRRARRQGALLFVAGVSGLVVVMALGLVGRDQATVIETYGYLVPGAKGHIGLLALGIGLVTHLGTALRVLISHLGFIAVLLLAGGVIGIISPLGLAAVAFVVLPDALSSQVQFIDFSGAFQNWPVEPFLIIGSAMAAAKLLQGRLEADRQRSGIRSLGGATRTMAIVIMLADGVLAAETLPKVPATWILDGPMAAGLARIVRSIPRGAEVIGEQNIVGRMLAGPVVYSFYRTGQRFLVQPGSVAVVLEPGLSRRDRSILRELEAHEPHSHTIAATGFEAVLWHATKPGTLVLTTAHRLGVAPAALKPRTAT